MEKAKRQYDAAVTSNDAARKAFLEVEAEADVAAKEVLRALKIEDNVLARAGLVEAIYEHTQEDMCNKHKLVKKLEAKQESDTRV